MSNNIEKKLTFDDVLLVPKYSNILPSETNIEVKIAKNLNLKVPQESDNNGICLPRDS